jgi:hypothetical protein
MSVSGMMMEHQPVSPSQASDSSHVYQPSMDEQKLVKKCDQLFQKAKKAKAKYDYAWIDYYKMFRGKQWKELRPSYRSSEVFNLIWQTVQSQIPVIMDARPKFEFLPQEPNDREFADLMNDICAADWAKNNWMFTLTEVMYDCTIFGTGLSCLKFDPKKNKLIYHSVDPFYMFPDPSAENFDRKCAYVVHAEPMDVAKIKRLFPDQADNIKADVVNFASEKRIDLSTMRYQSPSNDQLYTEVSGGYENSGPPEVLVKTIYMEDDEVIEEAADEAGGDAPMQKRLRFPNGRKTVIANEVVLQDGAVEYDDQTIFPYQRVINYIAPRSFWGISELEPLESPQRVFNKLVSYVLDVLYLTGNPVWIVSTDSGIDTDNLINQPGLIVEKQPGSEVRREEGVQLQPFVLQIIDRLKSWWDELSGSQDVMRGIAPGSVTAASAIDQLQSAAQTRIRLKMKNLDAYLQDFGQQYAARVMQFYTAPQVFRLTGKDGTERFFKMHIEKQQDGTSKAVVQRFTDTGMIHPKVDEYQLRGQLDVRVTTGSSLPFSKTEAQQRAYQLFDRGIIDSEEVLKSLEYPHWEAIQQRMQEKAAAQAQAQAQQQPQGSPPRA